MSQTVNAVYDGTVLRPDERWNWSRIRAYGSSWNP